ncbi:MAG: ABC-2 family transporter protein [Bdellovibrionales bacterium]|jgi:ABC-2 type transport system permease protein|nr:ABC-2 family transporter protein [Bdellovibrionales bacterium]
MTKIIKKYTYLFVSFFKASLMAELEFRFNIAARIVTDIVWYIAQLSVFEVLFRHTENLSGWTLPETRVFMGLLFVTDSIFMMLFSENLDRMGEKVRRGELDLLLVKPVNSQWMMSFQKVSVAYIGNFLISSAWLAWSLSQIESFKPINTLWLLLTVPIGLSIVYAIRFLTSATALFFTRADAINYIWYQVYRLGTRPDTIFPQILRYMILTVMPIAFLASVPAQIILGKSGPQLLVLGGTLSILLVYASSRFWKYGLKSYSSASS